MTQSERETLVTRMLPVVSIIARHVARICRLRDQDDLVGDGAVGLVRAVDAYDPTRGVTFDSYARHVILGAMLNGLRQRDPVSERARRRIREAERLRAELEARGAVPSNRDLENALPGLDRARAQVERGLPLSLDAPLPLGTSVHVDWSGDPARVFEKGTRRRIVRRAVGELPRRQRQIVVNHYFADVPLRALSARMAITPQRVSQLHCAALARLREAFGEAR